MRSGNSMADNEDREYQRRGECSCGGAFEEIIWCGAEHCRCELDCCHDGSTDCPAQEVRVKCRRCGAVEVAE